MENLEFNKKYTVRDNAPLSEIYTVWFEESKIYDDMIIIHDSLYDEVYYMTPDEIKETFVFFN